MRLQFLWLKFPQHLFPSPGSCSTSFPSSLVPSLHHAPAPAELSALEFLSCSSLCKLERLMAYSSDMAKQRRASKAFALAAADLENSNSSRISSSAGKSKKVGAVASLPAGKRGNRSGFYNRANRQAQTHKPKEASAICCSVYSTRLQQEHVWQGSSPRVQHELLKSLSNLRGKEWI